MIRKIFFTSLLFPLFLIWNVSGQSYVFHNINISDYFPNIRISHLVQDHEGYIWLGTAEGVSRLDGTEVVNFNANNGLAHTGGVFTLVEDSKKNIWIGHLNGGITRYNGKSFEIITLDSATISSNITSIIEDANGSLWFTSAGDGAFFIKNPSPDSTVFQAKQFNSENGLSDKIFNSFITPNGELYFMTDVGIKKYNPETNKFSIFSLKGLTKYWMKTVMFIDSQENIWVGTYHGGLYKYDSKIDSIIIYDKKDGLASNWITCITEDHNGHVWIGTWGGGVSKFEDDTIKTYNQENGLNALNIQFILEDKEANILIASQYHGLNVFKGENFVSIKPEEGLADKSVWAIQKDKKGRSWFGTNKGISVFDPLKTGKERIRIFNREKNMIGDNIRFIKEDMDNNLWISSFGVDVFQYLIDEEKFIFDSNLNQLLPIGSNVNALEIDNNNRIWIGASDRLIVWDNDKGERITYTKINGLAGNRITSLFRDSNENMWIGSEREKGLTKYDPDNNVFTIIDLTQEVTPNVISETNDGKIWFGTKLYGVFVIDNEKIVKHFDQNDGLLSPVITDLKIDNNNRVLIGTPRGLNIYDPPKDNLISIKKEDGLINNSINPNSLFIDKNNNLWVGTKNGISRIDLNNIKFDKPGPLALIKDIEINAISVKAMTDLKLKHSQNNISFIVGCNTFTNPESITYKAKLVGLNNNWIDYGNTSRISFPSLSPGSYTFSLMACNNYGNYSKDPKTYAFQITPPWWKTNIAYVFFFITLISSIFLYIKQRTKKITKQKNKLEKEVRERTAEIEKQKDLLNKQNKEINIQKEGLTDSIQYASRIQKAILTSDEVIKYLIPKYFLFYVPRDIVSGDFYWIKQKNNKIFIVIADCTGHGVPGAFMSMLGISLLNKVVNEAEDIQASELLNNLRDQVIMSLHQRGTFNEASDGMDLSLCILESDNKKIQFSGANNPLYLIRDSELIEIKGDKMPVGIHSFAGRSFTNHEIEVKRGDSLYLFSDGYADQFGGLKNKKFGYKSFRKLMIDIQDHIMFEQQQILEQTFNEWKGENEQIDDVIVMGIKI